MCSQVQYTSWIKGAMSSTNITEEMVEVIRDQGILGAEGNHEVTMHSSENEESEQDPRVDEALQVKSGEGTDSTKVEEEMDVNDSTPKVGDDHVKRQSYRVSMKTCDY